MTKGDFILGGKFKAKHMFWGLRIINAKLKELPLTGTTLGCDFHFVGGHK